MPTNLELLPPGMLKAIELILADPEAVAQKAAEAGILPPEVPAEGTAAFAAPGGLPQASSPPGVPQTPDLSLPVAAAQPAAAEGGVNTASFLQALQGVQAPQAPAVQRLPAAPSVPGKAPITPGIDEILKLLAPQQPVVPIDLARLILGR